MKMPQNIGPVHFVGIGGIGMSGIAEVLHNQGYQVRGSDLNQNPNVMRLQEKGITVEIGQRAENLKDAAVVVVSSAIKKDNPELMEARARRYRLCGARKCWLKLCALKTPLPLAARMAKPQPRPWWPLCLMRGIWTPPSLMAASLMPMAPTRG